jgi:hypothetical protein
MVDVQVISLGVESPKKLEASVCIETIILLRVLENWVIYTQWFYEKTSMVTNVTYAHPTMIHPPP